MLIPLSYNEILKSRSFTLIELIVVIAIIGVLSAVVVPSAFRALEKSKISRAAADIKDIKTAAMAYYTDTGTWPLIGVGNDTRASGAGFISNDNGAGVNVPGWDGPYIDKWPFNPWGNFSSSFRNKYYWDADLSGDDNGNGIIGEAQVIMFNIPRPSAMRLDGLFDDGELLGTDSGSIYQNQVVSGNSTTITPVTINWMVKEPVY